MNVATVGTGSIGSSFAYHLARHGHDVTVVARGHRLEQLRADNAIVTVGGERAAVAVRDALAPATEFDLVLVTVLASQVQTVLPSLIESRAKKVMFMANRFESLGPLRDAVGPGRFAFGFPSIIASLPDGRLNYRVVKRGPTIIATDARLAEAFTAAGIPTAVEADMESWLRTHAALIVPVLGVALVRRLGKAVTPRAAAVLSRLPTPVVAALFWAMSRSKFVRDQGRVGPIEPHALADAMIASAPEHTALLRSIQP